MDNYAIANEFVQYTTRSVFLTGKAGTGKTTFLRNLSKQCTKQMAVVAPTGVAAINAHGVTIHSFFQLPFTPFVPTPEGRQNLVSKVHVANPKRKVFQELELLVIDEISMVRADVLDEIDTILRHYRYNHHEPFGGVQVIFIGDLYQLAPVAVEEEWQVIAPYYNSPYFFDSMVIREHPPLYIEFDKVFRQKDPAFIRLLNAVRNDQLAAEDFELLQQRYDPDFDISKRPDHILLTTHNAKADKVNSREMARLKKKEHYFNADIQGEFPEKNFPNSARLCLKEGAKVMFIANDTDTPRRYYNGKIGQVSKIDGNNIYVRCEDAKSDEPDIIVKYEVWENIKYIVNPRTKEIEEKKLGSFKQFPLRLAWAITVHKSQGLTFDKVAIDIGAAFTSGQVYVALSRCRSLEGIHLLSQVNRSSLMVDPKVVGYSATKAADEVVQKLLGEGKEAYHREVLLTVFNFNVCRGQAMEVYEVLGQDADLFNGEANHFGRELRESVGELAVVGAKFCRQLSLLFSQNDEDILAERISAASEYFTKEIKKVLEMMKEADVDVDDDEQSREFEFWMKSLYEELARKKHVIRNIRKDYSTENCFKQKRSFKVPRIRF